MQGCAVPALSIPAVDIVLRNKSLHSCEIALLGCVEQGAIATKQIGDVLVALAHQVQRRGPVAVLLRRVRAVSQQQSHNFALALSRGLVQRSELPQVRHVHRCAVLHQKFGHLVVTVGTGVVKGYQTTATNNFIFKITKIEKKIIFTFKFS